MGFLSGLFHSRDNPTNSTYGSAYRFLFGGSNSGKSVYERSAMQMTAVYACVRILSEAIAGLPVHVYKYTGSGGKEKAIKHPLYRLIHDEPNPEMLTSNPQPKPYHSFSEPRQIHTVDMFPYKKTELFARML